jgi:hypothetical protein
MGAYTKTLTHELLFNNYLDEQLITNELNQTEGMAIG